MNPRLRSALIVIGILTIISLLIIVVPRAISLFYQARGGQHIEYVFRNVEGLNELVCEELLTKDELFLNEVDQGIDDLNLAIALNKNNSQAYFYLGKSYCLKGDTQRAIDSFQQYTALRPGNPLGYIGLGFAYDHLGDSDSAIRSWRSADLSSEDLSKYGDAEFNAERYQRAYQWYKRSNDLNGEMTPVRQFKWGAAGILSGIGFPEMIKTGDNPIYSLSESIKIDGDQLQWFREEDSYWNIYYGQHLSEHPTGDPGIGGIWWNGAAVGIVYAPCSTKYKIKVNVLHIGATDEIGQLQIVRDMTPVAVFTLSDIWMDFEKNIELTEGYHLIGVRYVEDVGDLYIESLIIDQFSDCGN